MLSQPSPVTNLPSGPGGVAKLQRVISPTSLTFVSCTPLSPFTSNSPSLKMTRFGFLSLALLSLQAFVGTGFAAVSQTWLAS